MSTPTHEQAVEAAKEWTRLPYLSEDAGGIMARHLLSAPRPSRDAFDAKAYLYDFAEEVLRLHYCGITLEEMANDIIKHESAELTAAIGGRGDDGEEVTREWFEKEIGDGDWEVWREDDRCDRVSVFINEELVVNVRVQDAHAGPEYDAWAPMPHVKTRGDVRRLLAALGIATEPAK